MRRSGDQFSMKMSRPEPELLFDFAKEHGRNQVCSYEKLLAEGKITAQEFRSDNELF